VRSINNLVFRDYLEGIKRGFAPSLKSLPPHDREYISISWRVKGRRSLSSNILPPLLLRRGGLRG
jgi:hypothetical protein